MSPLQEKYVRYFAKELVILSICKAGKRVLDYHGEDIIRVVKEIVEIELANPNSRLVSLAGELASQLETYSWPPQTE